MTELEQATEFSDGVPMSPPSSGCPGVELESLVHAPPDEACTQTSGLTRKAATRVSVPARRTLPSVARAPWSNINCQQHDARGTLEPTTETIAERISIEKKRGARQVQVPVECLTVDACADTDANRTVSDAVRGNPQRPPSTFARESALERVLEPVEAAQAPTGDEAGEVVVRDGSPDVEKDQQETAAVRSDEGVQYADTPLAVNTPELTELSNASVGNVENNRLRSASEIQGSSKTAAHERKAPMLESDVTDPAGNTANEYSQLSPSHAVPSACALGRTAGTGAAGIPEMSSASALTPAQTGEPAATGASAACELPSTPPATDSEPSCNTCGAPGSTESAHTETNSTTVTNMNAAPEQSAWRPALDTTPSSLVQQNVRFVEKPGSNGDLADPVILVVSIPQNQETIKYRAKDRVAIWNREELRKISGNAAPLAKNLRKYLAKYTNCEVYCGQDLDEQGRLRSFDARSGSGGLGEHVPIWNRVKKLKISGNASPLAKNLKAYLLRHPDCEVYTGQDLNLGHGTGSTAVPNRAALAGMATIQQLGDKLGPAAGASGPSAASAPERRAPSSGTVIQNENTDARALLLDDEASRLLLPDLAAIPQVADGLVAGITGDTAMFSNGVEYRCIAAHGVSCSCGQCLEAEVELYKHLDITCSCSDCASVTDVEHALSRSDAAADVSSAESDVSSSSEAEGVLFGSIEEYRPVSAETIGPTATLPAYAGDQRITITSIKTAHGLVLLIPHQALRQETEATPEAFVEAVSTADLRVDVTPQAPSLGASASSAAHRRYLVVPGRHIGAALAAAAPTPGEHPGTDPVLSTAQVADQRAASSEAVTDPAANMVSVDTIIEAVGRHLAATVRDPAATPLQSAEERSAPGRDSTKISDDDTRDVSVTGVSDEHVPHVAPSTVQDALSAPIGTMPASGTVSARTEPTGALERTPIPVQAGGDTAQPPDAGSVREHLDHAAVAVATAVATCEHALPSPPPRAAATWRAAQVRHGAGAATPKSLTDDDDDDRNCGADHIENASPVYREARRRHRKRHRRESVRSEPPMLSATALTEATERVRSRRRTSCRRQQRRKRSRNLDQLAFAYRHLQRMRQIDAYERELLRLSSSDESSGLWSPFRPESDDLGDGDIVIDPKWWQWTGDPLEHDLGPFGNGILGDIPWMITFGDTDDDRDRHHREDEDEEDVDTDEDGILCADPCFNAQGRRRRSPRRLGDKSGGRSMHTSTTEAEAAIQIEIEAKEDEEDAQGKAAAVLSRRHVDRRDIHRIGCRGGRYRRGHFAAEHELLRPGREGRHSSNLMHPQRTRGAAAAAYTSGQAAVSSPTRAHRKAVSAGAHADDSMFDEMSSSSSSSSNNSILVRTSATVSL